MVAKKVGVDYDMQTNKITNLGAPSGANDAARKDYVDTAVAGASLGLSWKQAVRAATAVAGTLATSFENGDVIDGVTLVTGDRILIKDQAAPEENGIYAVAATGAPARTTDAGTAANILQTAVFVQEGTVNADKLFLLTTNAPIVLGTTGLTFTQFSSGGGASLTVQEIDGAPLDNAVTIIRVTNGKLTDNGVGDVTLDLSGTAPGDSVLTNVHASRPGASNDGNLFLPSDGFSLERDTGAVYTPWGPIFPLTPPDDSQFAWINQGTASVSAVKNAIYLSTPKTSGSNNNRIRKKAAPSTPYVITAGFLLTADYYAGGATFYAVEAGLVFRQSSDGKLVTFFIGGTAGATNLAVRKWTSATAFSADYINNNGAGWALTAAGVIWLRVADNGTDRICSVSADGQNFIPVHTIGRTDFLTADEVGFFVRADSTSAGSLGGAGLTLLSWKES